MDEINPYASPAPYTPDAGEEASPPQPQPPGRPAWREGDVLVVPAKNAIGPRACVVTNRTQGVWRFRVVQGAPWVEPMLALLVLIPFAGLVVGAFAAVLLIGQGWAAEVWLWLRRPIALVHQVSQTAAALLMASANILTGLALVEQEMLFFILGLVAHAAAFGMVYLPDRVFIPLRARLGKDGVVRIRGAHPAYLDRLPEQDSVQEWDLRTDG